MLKIYFLIISFLFLITGLSSLIAQNNERWVLYDNDSTKITYYDIETMETTDSFILVWLKTEYIIPDTVDGKKITHIITENLIFCELKKLLLVTSVFYNGKDVVNSYEGIYKAFPIIPDSRAEMLYKFFCKK